MVQVYDSIAEQFKKFHSMLLIEYVMTYTYFHLLGDVTGKSILDLACGEGFYTRLLKQNGATRLVGVDISSEMIKLAKQQEEKESLGIEYIIADVAEIDLLIALILSLLPLFSIMPQQKSNYSKCVRPYILI